MKKFTIITLVAVAILTTTACSLTTDKDTTGNSETKQSLNIACMESGTEPLNALGKLLADKYVVKNQVFELNTKAIQSVDEGTNDAALAVHIKFMEAYNKNNHGDLVMIQPYAYTMGIGLYSEKYNSVEEIPQNAKIALMDDPINMDRSLRILQDIGLIKLDESSNHEYTVLDITENTKEIQFIETDQSQVVRMLSELDGGIAFFGHIKMAGKDFKSYLARDTDAFDYPIGIVVKKENENAHWAKELAETMQREEVRKALTDIYGEIIEFYED